MWDGAGLSNWEKESENHMGIQELKWKWWPSQDGNEIGIVEKGLEDDRCEIKENLKWRQGCIKINGRDVLRLMAAI